MISKTKINEKMNRKTNPELAKAIYIAKKNENLELARKLAMPTRQHPKMNLNQLNRIKEDKIIFVGKILGEGTIERKMTIYALGFSEQAKEKLKKAGCEIATIKKELDKDAKLKGAKLI